MRNSLILLVGLLVLGGAFLIVQPKTNKPSASVVKPAIKTFNLVVKDKKLVSGPEVIRVTQGDQVKIIITNDSDEELHLHGYDKAVDLEKDKPAELSFTATLTGHFEYELEHSKTEIGALEVSPK